MTEPTFRSRWHWEEIVDGPAGRLRVRVGRTGISRYSLFDGLALLRLGLGWLEYLMTARKTWTVSVTPIKRWEFAMPVLAEEFPTRAAAADRADEIVEQLMRRGDVDRRHDRRRR